MRLQRTTGRRGISKIVSCSELAGIATWTEGGRIKQVRVNCGTADNYDYEVYISADDLRRLIKHVAKTDPALLAEVVSG